MIGFIKKLFASIFGILGTVLTLPLKLIPSKSKQTGSKQPLQAATTPDAKAETTSAANIEKAPKAKKSKKKGGAFFLEADDAKGFSASDAKASPAPAQQPGSAASAKAPAATAAALNLPQPSVTTAASAANNYKQFGARRRPGANMKSYLDMAKTIKGA